MRPIRISCLIVIINVMTMAFIATAAHAIHINWTFNATLNDTSTITAGKLTYDTGTSKVISAQIEYTGASQFSGMRTFSTIIGSGQNFVSVLDPSDGSDYTNDPVFTINGADWTNPAETFSIFVLRCNNPGCTNAGGSGAPIAFANNIRGSSTTDPIPEPSTILLLSTGLLGLAGYQWHQRRREGTQVG